MSDYRIILALVSIFIAWKWGDWRNWKQYYSTILYLIIGDLSCILLTANKPLWQFESPFISNDFSEFIIAFICFPCTCLVFFALYSKIRSRKTLYVPFFLFCSLLYTSIEWLSYNLGYITYHNGWNLYWSFGFNFLMFPLLLLHFKKSLWVWPISLALAILMICLFDLPFSIIK
ncbi:CBO0543 family protein [Desulfosporosinus sp. SB140]|uniref:CBO0543 family protein n=1 Tax=Desulfosporosinus paludis TaxID=3115649 RepID=UPI00388F8C5A